MLQNLLLHVCIVYPFHFEIIFSSSTEIQFWEKLCLNKNSPYPEFWPIKTSCLETTSKDVNWVEEHCRLRLNQLQQVWEVFFFFKIFPVKIQTRFLICIFANFRARSNYPGLVEDGRPYGGEVFHLLQSPSNVPALRVDEPDQFLVCVLFPVVVFFHYLNAVMLTWLYLKSSRSRVSTSKVVNV